jgi:hypothetical protein
MTGVLDGVKVVEVSAWAFVPSAGGVMAAGAHKKGGH